MLTKESLEDGRSRVEMLREQKSTCVRWKSSGCSCPIVHTVMCHTIARMCSGTIILSRIRNAGPAFLLTRPKFAFPSQS
jgi:hypothetical protein